MNKAFPEELIVIHLVKNSPHFVQSEGSLPYSQKPILCIKSQMKIVSNIIPIALTFILILSSHLHLGLYGLFLSGCRSQTGYVFILSDMPHMSPPISFSLILLISLIIVRSTNHHDAPRRAFFCYCSLLLPLS
jgi:hypothetical protein